MIITGQQKIMLDKWRKGILKNTDLYKFLASRRNEIPYSITDDAEAIKYCISKAVVFTNVHRSINWYSKLPYSRITNRNRLKKSGVI